MQHRKLSKYVRYFSKMDNMDDPESNAKISDSAYSNSCSNSQSRRSHSSKSTHSGSNSSGSSGYGGKASTSGSSNILGPNSKERQTPKKDKQSKKKKKLVQSKVNPAAAAPQDEPERTPMPDEACSSKEASDHVDESSMALALPEKVNNEDSDSSNPERSLVKKETLGALQSALCVGDEYVASLLPTPCSPDGFSCVISMHDGVVMYASASLTPALGFPKEIWIGRSFIDFVHPKDHKTFASLITNGLAFPKLEKGKFERSATPCLAGPRLVSGSTMVCRVRRYRKLHSAFGVKNSLIGFMPFLLKFYFKDCSDEDMNEVYLVIQATPFFPAFKTPNEKVLNPVPFVTRHASDGVFEYIDPESVPYLGYLPQDMKDKNALNLYHPDDMPYIKQIYESIIKDGSASSSRPYRLMAQNGHYIKVETEWSSVVNPWSMKLEFVIAKHHIIEGPANPDVFRSPEVEKKPYRILEAEKYRAQVFKDSVIRILSEVRTKPAEVVKNQQDRRRQDLESFMETLIEEVPKEDDLKMDIQELPDRELNYYERDSVMLGGISPHHDSDSKSSTETPVSYTQLNYNENLQRYFDCQDPEGYVDYSAMPGPYESLDKSRRKCLSPLTQNWGEAADVSSDSSAVAIYSPPPPGEKHECVRLNEDTIFRHNAEMERELVKVHRETRSSRGEREKALNESRKHKWEHMARCKAGYQSTSAHDSSVDHPRKNYKSGGGNSNWQRTQRYRELKRASESLCSDAPPPKMHCPSSREPCYRHSPAALPSVSKPALLITTAASTQLKTTQNVSNSNTFGMPQQMPILAHKPATSLDMPSTSRNNAGAPILYTSNNSSRALERSQIFEPAEANVAGPSGVNMPGPSGVNMPGPSGVNMPEPSGVNRPGPSGVNMHRPSGVNIPGPSRKNKPGASGMQMPRHSDMLASEMHTRSGSLIPGVCQMTGTHCMPGMAGAYPVYFAPPGTPIPSASRQEPSQTSTGHPDHVSYMVHGHPISMMHGQSYVYTPSNSQVFPMDRELHEREDLESIRFSLPDSLVQQSSDFVSYLPYERCKAIPTSDENTDKTDGESSYSSFYSSFFKTDSGSAEDSGDQKKYSNLVVKNRFWTKGGQGDDAMSFESSTDATEPFPKPRNNKKLARQKMESPWNADVNMTPDLIYKYQLETKPLEEVLLADREILKTMTQSPQVSEQLAQLYLDLQLQGVAQRLTLEEGITSSSSSGEDASPPTQSSNKLRRKRDFNKLSIIYEENAPLPSPGSGLLAPEGEPHDDIVPIAPYYLLPKNESTPN